MNQNFMDDMMKMMGGVMHNASAVRDEMERMIQGQVQYFLQKMDVVTREEHEALKDVVQALSQRIEALEAAAKPKATKTAKSSAKKTT